MEATMTLVNRLLGNGDLWLYLVTLLGATAAYVFSLNKGFAGAVAFLQRMFPDRGGGFYARLDFFLVIFVGSGLGFILFGPTNNPQALMAGLGWVSTVNVLLSKIEKAGG